MYFVMMHNKWYTYKKTIVFAHFLPLNRFDSATGYTTVCIKIGYASFEKAFDVFWKHRQQFFSSQIENKEHHSLGLERLEYNAQHIFCSNINGFHFIFRLLTLDSEQNGFYNPLAQAGATNPVTSSTKFVTKTDCGWKQFEFQLVLVQKYRTTISGRWPGKCRCSNTKSKSKSKSFESTKTTNDKKATNDGRWPVKCRCSNTEATIEKQSTNDGRWPAEYRCSKLETVQSAARTTMAKWASPKIYERPCKPSKW